MNEPDEGHFPEIADQLEDEDGVDLQTLTLYNSEFPQLDNVKMGDLIQGSYTGRVTKIEGNGWKIKIHLDIHEVDVGNEADKAIRKMAEQPLDHDNPRGVDLDDDDEDAGELEEFNAI